jgi:hypothetical protein
MRELLIDLFTRYGTPISAAWLAYNLIELARQLWPAPDAPQSGYRRAFYTVLYAPMYARLLAIVLSGLLATVSAVTLAALQDRPIDPVAAAALSATINQLIHGLRQLSALSPASFVHPSAIQWDNGSEIRSDPTDPGAIGFTLPSGERVAMQRPTLERAQLQPLDQTGQPTGAPIAIHNGPIDLRSFFPYTLDRSRDDWREFLRAEGFRDEPRHTPISLPSTATDSGPYYTLYSINDEPSIERHDDQS